MESRYLQECYGTVLYLHRQVANNRDTKNANHRLMLRSRHVDQHAGKK